jgi:hypothetical protein
MSKRSLFANDEENRPGDSALKVNKKFAQSFERRKRAEELQRAKDLNLDPDDKSSETSYSSEDEDAELVNERVSEKFSNLIQMIRSNDSRIKDPNF